MGKLLTDVVDGTTVVELAVNACAGVSDGL